MIHSLLYVSKAATDMKPEWLERIITTAQARNSALGITGLLVYNGIHFMQLLEGPVDAVEATFDMISQDRCHSSISTLVSENTEQRSCPDWSMALQVMGAANDGPNQIYTVDHQTLVSFLPSTMAPDLRVMFQSFNSMTGAAAVAAE